MWGSLHGPILACTLAASLLCTHQACVHSRPTCAVGLQNQQNIATACDTPDTGTTFANSSVLLQACEGFLTNGELTSLGASPEV